MKIEGEYENFLARAVAKNHGKDEVLMALLACLSLSETSDGSVPLPESLTAHSSSLGRAKKDTPASADCMRCSPINELANFVITGHHFFQR